MFILEKIFEPEIGLEKVPLANGYRIVKFEDQFYCLYDEITVATRIVHQARNMEP